MHQSEQGIPEAVPQDQGKAEAEPQRTPIWVQVLLKTPINISLTYPSVLPHWPSLPPPQWELHLWQVWHFLQAAGQDCGHDQHHGCLLQHWQCPHWGHWHHRSEVQDYRGSHQEEELWHLGPQKGRGLYSNMNFRQSSLYIHERLSISL